MRARSRYLLGVAVAMGIGIALRIWFHVGFVGGFPQDDGIYITLARLLANHGDLLERYHHLPPTYLANPAEAFAFRIGFVYPLSWSFRVFGEGDGPAILVGIVSAALSIAVIAEIAKTAISPRAGVAAALLLALLPYDIILTTRVLSDGPLRLFVALACLFALRGWMTGSGPAFAWTGVMLGFAYLTKIPGFALFSVFGVALAIRCLKRRSARPLMFYALGFSSVVLVETAWYWWRTGQLFLHYRIVYSSILSKLKFEPLSFADIGPYGRVLWEGEFIWYAPIVLGLSAVGYHSLAGFGLQGWLWLAGLIRAVRSRAAGGRVLAGLAVGLYLFLEFFPLNVAVADGRLQYALVYRQWRFASFLTPAWIPLGGGVLAAVWERSTAAAAVMLAVCAISGWPALVRNHEVLRGSQADMRSTAAFIQHRPEPIYTDRFAVSILRYYMGSAEAARQVRDISVLGGSPPAPGDLVIVGGSRSIELLSDEWERDLPAWCPSTPEDPDSSPPGWRVLLRIPGRHDMTRVHDLLILQRLGS